MFRPSDYTLTKTSVELRGVKLPRANPATFRHVTGSWSCDDKSVFWACYRLSKIDAATFEPFNELFCRDRSAVYSSAGMPLKDVNPDEFRAFDSGVIDNGAPGVHFPMHQGYGGDSKRVFIHVATYSASPEIKGADPASFVSLGFGYARDKENVYYERNKIKGALADSIHLIGCHGYAADYASVYYEGRPVEGADPNTFALLHTTIAARDVHRYYLCGRPATIEEYLKFVRDDIAQLEQHITYIQSGEFESHFARILEAHP